MLAYDIRGKKVLLEISNNRDWSSLANLHPGCIDLTCEARASMPSPVHGGHCWLLGARLWTKTLFSTFSGHL